MKRIIIGITGASGAIYGMRALQALRAAGEIETHLVLSPSGKRTIIEETDWSVEHVESLADVVHAHRDIGASIVSGSFRTAGMLVAPCSIKSLSGIVNSYDDNLLSRAADVCLKERRTLVLLLRETPLTSGTSNCSPRRRATEPWCCRRCRLSTTGRRPSTTSSTIPSAKRSTSSAFRTSFSSAGRKRREWTRPVRNPVDDPERRQRVVCAVRSCRARLLTSHIHRLIISVRFISSSTK